MGNLDLWNSVERTDHRYVKPITGKPYKGTSPSPFYLIHKATETFGPCGIGWGFTFTERIEEGAPGDRVHIAHVKVWYKWTMPGTMEQGALVEHTGEVSHIGQTMFCGRRRGRDGQPGEPYTDEDAPKKSVTDGLIKALSMLGFAGDIFMGRYDDSKYVDEVKADIKKEEAEKPSESSMQYAIRFNEKVLLLDTEKAVRTFWTNEGRMRSGLNITKGSTPYAMMASACAKRIMAIQQKTPPPAPDPPPDDEGMHTFVEFNAHTADDVLDTDNDNGD